MSEKIGWNPVVKRKYPSVKKKTSKRKAPPKGKGLTFKERMKIATAKLRAEQASMPTENPSRAKITSQKETKTKKSAWHGIRMGIIERRAKTTMPHTKYVKKNVIVPKGHEIVEGEDDRTSKVQKAPAKTDEDIRLRVPSGGIEATKGVIRQKVTTEEPAKTHWRDFYTNEVISKPEHIEIDHVIPITSMRKRGVLQSLESQQLFGNYLKNLVITKAETNQKKSGRALGKFTPPHKPERYARKYHDVLKDFGAIMSVDEHKAYMKHTGELATIEVQNPLDRMAGKTIKQSQMQHDAWKRTMAKRNSSP